MKGRKRITKFIIAFICVMIVALTSNGIEAFALTINDSGNVSLIDVEWENPTEVVAIETQEKQFIMSTNIH